MTQELTLCDCCENRTENPEIYAQIVWGKPQPPIVLPKTFYCEYKMCRIQYCKARKKRCDGYTPID